MALGRRLEVSTASKEAPTSPDGSETVRLLQDGAAKESTVNELTVTPTSGSTARTLADWVAASDGVIVDRWYDTLALAVAGAVSAGAPLLVTKAWTQGADLTISCDLIFFGGSITVSSTFTVTINRTITGPRRQIFAGDGAVIIARQEVRPEWGGVTGNGSSDDYAGWVRTKNFLPISVGGTIDATGIVNTLVSARVDFDRPVYLRGSVGLTQFYSTSATAGILNITAQSFIEGVAFNSTVTQSAGAYITVSSAATNTTLIDCRSVGHILFITSAATSLAVTRARFRNGVATTGIGIQITDGAGILIENPEADNTSNIAAGIQITKTDDVTIINPSLVNCGKALHLYATTGNVIASVVTVGGFYDTSTYPAFLDAAGGSIVRTEFTDVWFGSGTNTNVTMQSSSGGGIDGVDFNGCQSVLSGSHGVTIADTGVVNVRWNGGYICQNTGNGFNVAADVSQFAVCNARIGNGFGLSANGNGIVIAAGTSTNYQILDNDLRGNTTANLSNGATGTARHIQNNLGAPVTGEVVLRAQSAVQNSHTGDTNETVQATIAVPANIMGPNGYIVVRALYGASGTNTKTPRIRLGGIGGTAFFAGAITTQLGLHFERIIHNRNATNSQVTYAAGNAQSYAAIASGASTGSVDTTGALDLVLTGQLTSSGETIVLEAYSVEVIYGA